MNYDIRVRVTYINETRAYIIKMLKILLDININ